MASLLLLKNKKTGKAQSMYTVDARELMNSPEGENWEYVRRMDRSAKMLEPGVAAETDADGAVEFSGEAAENEATRLSLAEPAAGNPADDAGAASTTGAPSGTADLVEAVTKAEEDRGQRGGGAQEPASSTEEE